MEYTRRKALRGVTVAGVPFLAGCSTSLSLPTESSVEYRLDDVVVENVDSEPKTFDVRILDGDEILLETTVSLEGKDGPVADSRTIEEPWMEEAARYGVEVIPSDGESHSCTLSDVLRMRDSSWHEYEYIEYTVLHQSGTFRFLPHFSDEPTE